jgi:hypothetical protein
MKCQKAMKYTKIVHPVAFLNMPKVAFLVCKYTIWGQFLNKFLRLQKSRRLREQLAPRQRWVRLSWRLRNDFAPRREFAPTQA